MRIAFVYTIGRPSSFIGRSFDLADNGGSEGSAIRFALELAKLGNDVSFFTPEAEPNTKDGVSWHAVETGEYKHGYDVAIAIRFPNVLLDVEAKVKALYCCDPEIVDLPAYTKAGFVNLVMVISKYQMQLFQLQHPIDEKLYFETNAGIHWNDYNRLDIPKVRGRCIYCSAPVRGLSALVGIWPLIRKSVPWATLHVMSSLCLWGIDYNPCNDPLISQLTALDGVTYRGFVSREELIEEQLQSVLLLLPGNQTSPEMCCMAAMECAAAKNALLVTDIAALPERVVPGKSGSVIYYSNNNWQCVFADTAAAMLRNPDLSLMHLHARAFERAHDYSVLARQWLYKFNSMM
jgi:glycosyltransferase involved in cell wall biosynthesis